MTPRKKAVIPLESPEPFNEVDELMAQLDGGSIIAKLQRENLTTKRWDHVGRLEPVTADFLDDVRAAYGGGNYRARFYNGGQYIKGGYKSFSVAGKPKDDDDDTKPGAPAAAAPAVKSGVEWAKDIAAVVTPLAAALATLVPIFRGSGNSGTDVVKTVSMLHEAEERGERRGRTIGQLEAGGPREKEATMLDVAREYAGPFFKLMADRQQAHQAPPQQIPPQHPPAQLPAPMAPPLPTLHAAYSFLVPIRPAYAMLAAQASTDRDPGVIADFVLAQMDEPQLRAMVTATTREDFMATMRAELAPIAERYPEWLDDFLSRIVQVCQQEEEEETPAPSPKAKRGKKNV